MMFLNFSIKTLYIINLRFILDDSWKICFDIFRLETIFLGRKMMKKYVPLGLAIAALCMIVIGLCLYFIPNKLIKENIEKVCLENFAIFLAKCLAFWQKSKLLLSMF